MLDVAASHAASHAPSTEGRAGKEAGHNPTREDCGRRAAGAWLSLGDCALKKKGTPQYVSGGVSGYLSSIDGFFDRWVRSSIA